MVVFQYRKTTISVSLRLQMAERCSWTTACLLWRNYDYRFFYKILYALAQEKWCVVGLAFVMNKTCAALNYVPVRVSISVWILFRDREKMTEILKATRKTMQISRVFIIILLLNEITYDFFSLCRIMHFYLQLDVSLVLFILVDCIIVSCFISSWHYFWMIRFVSFKTAL